MLLCKVDANHNKGINPDQNSKPSLRRFNLFRTGRKGDILTCPTQPLGLEPRSTVLETAVLCQLNYGCKTALLQAENDFRCAGDTTQNQYLVSPSRLCYTGNTSQGNRTQDQSPDTRTQINYRKEMMPRTMDTHATPNSKVAMRIKGFEPSRHKDTRI